VSRYNVSSVPSSHIHIAELIVTVPGDIHIYIDDEIKQKKIWERAAEPISFQIRSPLQQLLACSVNYVRDNNGALNYNQKSLPSLVSETDRKMARE